MQTGMVRSSILDHRQNDTSFCLDLCRYLAAQAVCVGHAISFFGVAKSIQPPRFPYIQNLGVIIFFILSGFLIAHVLISRRSDESYGLGSFLIERTARIYTAYLPALLFILGVDLALTFTVGFPFEDYLGWRVFMGNVLMLQNYLGPFPGVPGLGSAGHLWSLAVEFHIYLFVGAVFFVAIGRRWRVAMLVAVLSAPMPLAFFSGESHDLPGTGLFILWLLGFAAYGVCALGLGRNIPLVALFCVGGLSAAIWLHRSPPGAEYRIQVYSFLFIAFLCFVLLSQRTRFTVGRKTLQTWVRFGANYSFSLYLIHHSILYALLQFWPEAGAMGAVVGIIVANLAAMVFAYYTEFRHKAVALYLKAQAAHILERCGRKQQQH